MKPFCLSGANNAVDADFITRIKYDKHSIYLQLNQRELPHTQFTRMNSSEARHERQSETNIFFFFKYTASLQIPSKARFPLGYHPLTVALRPYDGFVQILQRKKKYKLMDYFVVVVVDVGGMRG